jgi:hypothetical protein
MTAVWGVLAVAAYMTAALYALRAYTRWGQRIENRRAQLRQQHIDDIEARAGHWRIDDDELADWLAIGTKQLNDEIKKQREEGDR